MPIRAVLFDLDNTLIDFMTMKRKSCEAAVDAMISAGLRMPKRRAMEMVYEIYEQQGMEYNRIFQDMLEKVLGKVDYRMLAEGIVAYRRAQVVYMRTYPEAKRILAALKAKGIKLGIVSDALSVNGWIRLVELGIQDFFDVVITLHDTGEKKPSPAPFKKAIDALGVGAGDVLFVGDWVERDIAGAKAMGMKTAFARYGAFVRVGKSGRTKRFRPETSGADYDLDGLTELLGIVK
jgi:putative hydrolase of the HAD superfamily